MAKPFRADGGLQVAASASWLGPTGVPGLRYDSVNGWTARKPDNTEFVLGGGGASLGNYSFSASTFNMPANALFSGASSATNTTGLTIASNVIDGASSIGIALNASTALTSGKLLSIQSAGSEKWSFSDDGALFNFLKGSRNRIQVLSANSYGIYADGDGGAVNIMTAGQGRVIITNTAMASDGIATLGNSGSPWPAAWSKYYATIRTNVSAAASVTIDPTVGSLFRVLLSATAITTMTVNPGQPGQRIIVEVIEDATGTRTIPTTWTNVVFPSPGTYTATATANKRDKIQLDYDDADAKWYATTTLNL